MNDYETIRKVFERDRYICQHCGRNIREGQPQRAHILGQGKITRKRFGNKVIDSPHNMLSACSLECNNKLALNWYANPIKADKFAQKVKELEESDERREKI